MGGGGAGVLLRGRADRIVRGVPEGDGLAAVGTAIALERLCAFGEVLEIGDCAHDGMKRTRVTESESTLFKIPLSSQSLLFCMDAPSPNISTMDKLSERGVSMKSRLKTFENGHRKRAVKSPIK